MEQKKQTTQKNKKNTNIQKEFSQIGKQIKNYIITSQLGQGGFGTVWQGIDQNSGEQIAIKQVNKEVFKQNPKVKELFNCEIESLKKINNPNVVKYLDDFETKNNSYLVLEYCNDGNMEEYIENKPNQVLSEKEAILLFHQILNGYKALHEQNIIHRDLKLENILRHNDQIKLCDLGFAKQLNSPQDTTKTILGTSVTMAPEILLGKKYGIEADIYSLGVILYCMVLGRYPYKANNDDDLIYMIKTEPLRLQRKNIKISPQLKDLLSKMLVLEKEDRINWAQLYEHPVFNQSYDQNQFQSIAQEIHFYDLIKSKYSLNFEQNKSFYKTNLKNLINKESFTTNNNDSQLLSDNNQQQSRNIQESINEPDVIEPIDNEKQIQIQKEIELKVNENKQKYSSLKKAINIYLNERSRYSQLAKCLVQMHQLPQMQINTLVPAYFLTKQLMLMNEKLLFVIQKKMNIFNLKYFEFIVESEIYKLFEGQLLNDQVIIELYYVTIQFDAQELINAYSFPNPEILGELEKDKTEKYIEIYQEQLMEYYVGLQEESEVYLKSANIQTYQQFLLHQILILDCLNANNIFKPLGSDQLFDYQNYYNFLESLNIEQLQIQIEKKFALNYEYSYTDEQYKQSLVYNNSQYSEKQEGNNQFQVFSRGQSESQNQNYSSLESDKQSKLLMQ